MPIAGTGTNSTTDPVTETTPPSMEDFNRLAQSAYRACPRASNRVGVTVSTSNDPTRSSSYLGGRDVSFYTVSNGTGKTGVVFLSTFAPEPATEACFIRFYVDMVFGLRNLSQAGVRNILIDTSNNGGGYIVLSQIAQLLVAGQKFQNEANFESVLRRSALTEAILQRFIDTPRLANSTSTFNPSTYRNNTSLTTFPRDYNYFNPGREYSINGVNLRTSNLLRDSLEQVVLLDMLSDIPDVSQFAPENFVFIGSGTCGSACASFSNFLIEYYQGTGYIQSSQPSKPIEVSFTIDTPFSKLPNHFPSTAQ